MNRLPKALTEEQLAALLDQAKGRSPCAIRTRAALLLMADSGLRIGEVCSLETGNLKREQGEVTSLHLTHTKGGHERIAYLPVRARDALGRWLERRATLGLPGRHVFCTLAKGIVRSPGQDENGCFEGGNGSTARKLTPGRPMATGTLRGVVRRLADRAGLPPWVTPHSLRHTFAMRLYGNTRDLEVVRRALGHSRIGTTQIYAQANDHQVAGAVASLDKTAETEEVQRLAKAMAALSGEQRAALADVLLCSG